MNKKDLLNSITFGQRVAEEEGDFLATYFVETDQWKRLYSGEVDIVYGPKGSGKSALYSLLISKDNELFDRSIFLVIAENPRGATVFKDLAVDPPVTEQGFMGLWKLYFACLLHGAIEEYSIVNQSSQKLGKYLAQEKLIKGKASLKVMFQSVLDYARRIFHPQSLETSVEFDSITQSPKFSSKIVLNEPSPRNVSRMVRQKTTKK
jgi:hypothetical protein